MSTTERKRDIENRHYLVNIVNPILEPLMLEVVKNKPKNIVSCKQSLYFTEKRETFE